MKPVYFKILPNLIVLFVILSSCHNMRKDDRVAVINMTGKEIVLPDSLTFMIQDIPVEYDFFDADYKIITYIDSKGCTTCQMKLKSWNDLINDFKRFEDVNVSFLMILNTDVKEDVISGLKHNFFRHPVSFDPKGEFQNLNSLSSEPTYHTMLLGKDNKIVAVGNPVLNPKIKELYKQIMTEKSCERFTGLCRNPVIPLGVVNPGDTVSKRFNIVNNESNILRIQAITLSCDCILTTISLDTIYPGETIFLSMRFIADSIPGYFAKYADVYFFEKQNPERLLVHGFIANPNINL